jgi:hypothetical protein
MRKQGVALATMDKQQQQQQQQKQPEQQCSN